MPLNWNVEKVAEHETLCFETVTVDGVETTRVTPVTQALTFLTLVVGMPRITEANADEFAYRVAQAESVSGAWVSRVVEGPSGSTIEPRPVTAADVRAHIGLATNASAKTKAQFEKDQRRAYADKQRLARV